MSSSIQRLEGELQRELGRVVVGTESPIRALVIALVARGHVLVQGVPGLGKTLLAKTLARVLGGEFKRIQGTPDLMPSDIIGVHIFDESQRNFVFRPGPLFADVVLVDEVNRARVLAGFHFRRSDEAGSQLGRQVARFVVERSFGCGRVSAPSTASRAPSDGCRSDSASSHRTAGR